MAGREPVMSGGCQCGAVRYALYAPPESSVCHCRMCQKAVGGPFAALSKVLLTDFAWTRGQPGSFQSSSVAMRDFCAACGTPLTFRFIDGDGLEVTTGSLDHPDQAPITRNFGTESRLPWIAELVPGRLPDGTTEAANANLNRQSATSRQHPDHDTEAGWAPPR